MREKISGKCCFRSKEKILEGSNGLRWGSIHTLRGMAWVAGTIHWHFVMLGNCGDRVTAQGTGVSPCSDAAMHDVWW